MDALTLGPIKSLSGEVRLPGSKSISNRALLLAALAQGRTRILNLLDGEDTELMRHALDALGIAVTKEGDAWAVAGGSGPLVTDGRCAELDLGLAGTAMRPLTAALTLGNGEFVLDGSPRMRERPIGHLVDALRALGADIDYTAMNGYPPVRIRAGGLAGGVAEIDGSVSSQFLTAVLLAAPLAQRPVTLHVRGELVSKPYIDITLDLMARFGAEVSHQGHQRFEIANSGYRSPANASWKAMRRRPRTSSPLAPLPGAGSASKASARPASKATPPLPTCSKPWAPRCSAAPPVLPSDQPRCPGLTPTSTTSRTPP